MRIADVRLTTTGARRRLSATATWEAIDRPAEDIWFEVPEEHGDHLAAVGDPFLVGASVLAMLAGERRLVVEDACPELAEGVRTALAWLTQWYPAEASSIEIETSSFTQRVVQERHAGSLLSGGVDSLAVLKRNHDRLPEGHPSRIGTCILVDWNAGSDRAIERSASEAIEAKRQSLEACVQSRGVRLVPVYSNLLSLRDYPRVPWWGRMIHGLAFGAAAHALAGGLHTVYIASSYDVEHLGPWGSHPLVDFNLRSGTPSFVHDGIRLSRFERTAAIADWPEALDVLSVCVGPYSVRADRRNCGRCEKCVRTALSLLALGKLDGVPSLGWASVSRESVERVRVTSDVVASFWIDLAAGLRANAFDDLASMAERKVSAFKRRKALHSLDSRLLRGAGAALVRRVRQR